MHPFLDSYLMFFSKMRKKTKRNTCYLDSRMTLLGAVRGVPGLTALQAGAGSGLGRSFGNKEIEALGEAPD